MNGTIRVGVVGAGYVCKYHLAALKSVPGIVLAGIADTNREAAAKVAAQFAIEGVYSTLAEMAAARLQAVYILTPPSSHAALALEALEMGCHVYVEKPMAETAEDCRRMIDKAKEKGLTLSVNHSARLDPVVLKAVELVRSGACGDILGVEFLRSSDYAQYAGGPPSGLYRKGSYPFQDLGVHGLYLLEAFLGPIRGLRVEYRNYGRNNPNLSFDEWRAEADCGLGVGRMYLSWNVRPMQNRLIVLGTAGVLEVDCFLQTLRVSRNLPGPKFVHMVIAAVRNGFSVAIRSSINAARFVTGGLQPSPGIYNGARMFAEALIEGTEPPVSAEEGYRMVALMETASRQADEEKNEQRRQQLAPLPPARVLVTGAGGFLGRALVGQLLRNGEQLRVMARRPLQGSVLNTVIGDLGDPEAVHHAVKGVEVVYHVGAAMKGGRESFESGTIVGTRNVIEACLRHGVKRLVYVSSLSVLDHAGHAAGTPYAENAPVEPYPERRGLYTQTKLDAERMVLDAVREKGLPAVILRPGQIFGPGAEKVPPSGTIGIAGRWVVVGSGDAPLPLVYLDDVASALRLAAEKPGIEGRIFHLVDPTPVTQREYIAAASRREENRPKVILMPRWLMMTLATGVEMLGKLLKRSVPLTPYRVRSLRPLSVNDGTAAATDLGWKPEVGTLEGLNRTFAAKAEPQG